MTGTDDGTALPPDIVAILAVDPDNEWARARVRE